MTDFNESQEVPEVNLEARVKELVAENERLRKHNETVLGEKKGVKNKYESLETEYQQLLEFKKAAELKELEEKKQYSVALEKVKQEYETKLEEFKKQYTNSEKTLAEQKESLEKELSTYKLDLKVLDELAKAGAINPKQTLKLIRDNLKLSEEGKILAEDGYKQLDLSEFIQSLKTNTDYNYLFKSEAALKGTAGRTLVNHSSTNSNNPFSKDSWNLTRQAELFKNNRKLYDKLKDEANNS